MKGRVFKRCTNCQATVRGARCDRCVDGSTSWYYVVDVGQDSEGRRQQRKRGGFRTKRDAQKALRELLNTLDGGRYVEPNDLTLGTYLEQEWLPATTPPKVRSTTWASYASQIRLHVVPHLGGVPLQKLNPLHLNKLYSHLRGQGRRDGAGGLSARTVEYIHSIVHKALADARRWGLLESNPAELADPPRQGRAGAGAKMRTWTEEQLARFLDAVRDDRLYACWLLAATTGMRRSELLGLRWDDVDLEALRLSVRHTLVMSNNRPTLADIPKSKSSRRSVDLDTHTVSSLRGFRAVQDVECHSAGSAWANLGLVFTRPSGDRIRPDNWSTAFKRSAQRAGVPPIRPHDLRHTHATLMLAQGVHPKVVSERLGHHSVAFTLEVYSHIIPGMQSEAAQRTADSVIEKLEDAETQGEEGD